jgi:hypothetical protein
LPVRERRLLFSGWFRVFSSSCSGLSSGSAAAATTNLMATPTVPVTLKSPHPRTPQQGSILSLNPLTKSPGGSRTNRLVDAIHLWDRRPKPERSASVKSSASSVTTSLDTLTSAATSDASRRSSRLPRFKNLFRRRSATKDSSATSSVGSGETAATSVGSGDATDRVLVYVFDDLLLLLTSSGVESRGHDLVPKIGLSRVFSVDSDANTRSEGQFPYGSRFRHGGLILIFVLC